MTAPTSEVRGVPADSLEVMTCGGCDRRPATVVAFSAYARVGGFASLWCAKCARDLRDELPRCALPKAVRS